MRKRKRAPSTDEVRTNPQKIRIISEFSFLKIFVILGKIGVSGQL